MRNDFIDVEVTETQVVTCPSCGQRNRVHKQHREVSFRCGACKTKLPNPFALGRRLAKTVSALARRSHWSARHIGLAFFAILVLAVVALISLPSGTPRQDLPQFEQVRAIQPAQPLPPARQLENGTVITALARVGNGTLKIDNGTGRDAVIKVVDERAQHLIIAFYVCAGQHASVERIPDGDFRIIFASGSDWDFIARTFTREKSFAKFDMQLDFVTTQDARSYKYSVFTLTLHRVVHGNAKATNVGEEEFLKY